MHQAVDEAAIGVPSRLVGIHVVRWSIESCPRAFGMSGPSGGTPGSTVGQRHASPVFRH